MELSENEVKKREHTLLSYSAEIIRSLRSRGYQNAMLSESLIELIQQISKSNRNFEDPLEFDKIRIEIEEHLKS